MSETRATKSWDELFTEHSQFLEKQNWLSDVSLNSVALVMSEVGETFAELINIDYDISKIQLELADIVLRIFGLYQTEHKPLPDLSADVFVSSYGKYDFLAEIQMHMIETIIHLSHATNAYRKELNSEDMLPYFAQILQNMVNLCAKLNIDLQYLIEKKIELNLQRTHTRKI